MPEENVDIQPTPEPQPEPTEGQPSAPYPTGQEPDDVDVAPDVDDEYSKNVQKRINKAVRSQREAERRAAFLEGQLDAERRKTKPPETPSPAVPVTPKPREDDFETHAEFIEALTDWRFEQKQAQWDAEQRRKAEQDHESVVQQSFQQKMAEGYEKYDDFHEVAFNPTNPINAVMAEIIGGSEKAADLAYYLGTHTHEAVKISKMPAMEAARQLGMIEAKLAAAEASNPRAPKNPNTPPPPITPVGSGGGDIISKDPEKMSNAEYRQMREEQRKSQRR